MSPARPETAGATTRLVLRDGSTAGVRRASPSDRDAMRRFFDELSPNSRRLRFLGSAAASDDLIARLHERTALLIEECAESDRGRQALELARHFSAAAALGYRDRAAHYAALAGSRSLEQYANEQAAERRAGFAMRVVEAADPPAPTVVGAMPPQHVVHLIDQAQREVGKP